MFGWYIVLPYNENTKIQNKLILQRTTPIFQMITKTCYIYLIYTSLYHPAYQGVMWRPLFSSSNIMLSIWIIQPAAWKIHLRGSMLSMQWETYTQSRSAEFSIIFQPGDGGDSAWVRFNIKDTDRYSSCNKGWRFSLISEVSCDVVGDVFPHEVSF